MSRTVSDIRDDLEDRVAELTKEVRAMRKTATKRGYSAYGDVRDGASDIFDEVWAQVQHSLPMLRRHARGASKTIRDNPATTTAAAVVGVAVIGLLATLLLRRD
jgi:ElaB/YqjD/DUF883 family membrane-anchored ribosome-binding protein